MERKNQIWEAGQQYLKSLDEYTYPREAFIEGAKWADEHPNENLVDINKATQWVRNILIGTVADGVIDNIVRDFVIYMKK